jgi:hypothetical protein
MTTKNRLTQSFPALQNILNSEAIEVALNAQGISYINGTGALTGDVRLRADQR